MFGWIFFRANSVADAIYIITHIFSGIGFNKIGGLGLGVGLSSLFMSVFLICTMELIHILQGNMPLIEWISRKLAILRWLVYYLCVIAIINLGVYGNNQLIYF